MHPSIQRLIDARKAAEADRDEWKERAEIYKEQLDGQIKYTGELREMLKRAADSGDTTEAREYLDNEVWYATPGKTVTVSVDVSDAMSKLIDEADKWK